MTTKTFSYALGEIGDKYITEANEYTATKKKHNWRKWCAVAACLCLVMATAIVHLLSPLKTNVVATDRVQLATSVNSLKDVSDLILIAYADRAGENTLIRAETGDIVSGYTNTTLTIDTIFKGDVQTDSQIAITEECYTTAFGTVFWTQQGYVPIQSGTKYLLFLKAYPDDSDFAGMYYPVDLEYGKYVIPSGINTNNLETLSNSREELEVGTATDLDVYLEWYYTIMQEYISDTKPTE